MQTAKFFDCINGSPVKIKLREGQSISHSSGGLTDEGFDYTTKVWTFEDGFVVEQIMRRAKDCDGPLDTYNAIRCHSAKLKSGCIDSDFDGVVYPAWQHVDGWQVDAFAEAAGY